MTDYPDAVSVLSNVELWNSLGLRYANLRDADLRGADLSGANLHSADLRGANLRDADLHSASLGHANLRGANLHSADLLDADLRGANLRDADLSGSKGIPSPREFLDNFETDDHGLIVFRVWGGLLQVSGKLEMPSRRRS